LRVREFDTSVAERDRLPSDAAFRRLIGGRFVVCPYRSVRGRPNCGNALEFGVRRGARSRPVADKRDSNAARA
jgi:hypothetical protein